MSLEEKFKDFEKIYFYSIKLDPEKAQLSQFFQSTFIETNYKTLDEWKNAWDACPTDVLSQDQSKTTIYSSSNINILNNLNSLNSLNNNISNNNNETTENSTDNTLEAFENVPYITFYYAEQYMMFSKAILFGDLKIAKKILEADSPPKIKALGRMVSNFSEDVWKFWRFKIVSRGNFLKFSQNKNIQDALLLDKSNDILFVEASPSDKIWGIGINLQSAMNGVAWKGSNLLGLALTDTRTRLLKIKKFE